MLVFPTPLVYCCPSTLSETADSVWLWGVGVLSCVVDHIMQEFNTLFLTRVITYKIATPPQTKMTSKEDI
jgi:hypothetical protein